MFRNPISSLLLGMAFGCMLGVVLYQATRIDSGMVLKGDTLDATLKGVCWVEYDSMLTVGSSASNPSDSILAPIGCPDGWTEGGSGGIEKCFAPNSVSCNVKRLSDTIQGHCNGGLCVPNC